MVHAVTPPPNRAVSLPARGSRRGGRVSALDMGASPGFNIAQGWHLCQESETQSPGWACRFGGGGGCVAGDRAYETIQFGGYLAVCTALTFTQTWRANAISIRAAVMRADYCLHVWKLWYGTLYIYSDFIPLASLLLTTSWLELAFPVVSWKYCHPKTRRRKRGSMKSSQCHTVTRKIWGDRAQARLSKTSQENKTASGFEQCLILLRSLARGYRFYSQCFKKSQTFETTFNILKSLLYTPVTPCWLSVLLLNRKYDMDRHGMLSFN